MALKKMKDNPISATAEGTICVKQVRSGIGLVKSQRACLAGLGLGRIGKTRILVDTPCVRGLIRKVSSLVAVVNSND